jgi:hypothetical protein
MLVRLGWPDCYYCGGDGKSADERQDAYWVECSADEGLPLLAGRTDDPQVPPETLGWGRATPYPIDQQVFCFLIARDGSSIAPFPADYPTSSRWRGRSPFGRVGPFDIRDISELADLPAPQSREIPIQHSAPRAVGRKAMQVIIGALSRLRRR